MFFFLWISCLVPKIITPTKIHEVRFRPAVDSQEPILQYVPNATWDHGLSSAVEQLLLEVQTPESSLDHQAIRIALSRVGFPGQARFAKILNGGDFPQELINQILNDVGSERVDVALRSRSYGNGSTLWLVGWSPHLIELDPIPRDVALDSSFSIRMKAKKEQKAVLFIAPPDGEVESGPLLSEASRSVPNMHIPGEYRYEVIVQSPQGAQVAALFSVFSDAEPERIPALRTRIAQAVNPNEAEQVLYKAVNDIRVERGLRPLQRFVPFEALAREHSAFMASAGVVAHNLPNITKGVKYHAGSLFHPYAEHHESIAAAKDAQEALDVVVSSPAHLKTFLCRECTHLSIGATIEPVLDRVPRLFVTWEMLNFPQGEPLRKDRFTKDE